MFGFIKYIVILVLCTATAFAGDAEEIKRTIEDDFAYLNKNKRSKNEYSKNGALEFWSSGGLLHEIDASGRPETYDEVNLSPKHIEVLVLAPGKAAAAFYYSEGSLKPKGSAGVDHYLTRVSQTFVKEGGKWKTRSSHWSPVKGGSGTSQTGKE
tara:strand:- start:199 stop:660 length:462 start_codon:yes stop_codon:yes gene_type:complete